MKFLAKGKRSRVYVEKDLAIKRAKPEIVRREVKWLKILNKHDIGPKLKKYNRNSFSYKYVEGKRILDWIKSNKNVKSMLVNILNQCRTLDKLKINKLELTNPYKHIIINKKPVMIDFERCYKTDNPKNVTQFCQYMMSRNVFPILEEKNLNINKKEFIKILKKYKSKQTDNNFECIISFIENP
ncbi:hypothetical protein K8R47_00960 [archaeon]|nr:hypothetical protein [archaeon]